MVKRRSFISKIRISFHSASVSERELGRKTSLTTQGRFVNIKELYLPLWNIHLYFGLFTSGIWFFLSFFSFYCWCLVSYLLFHVPKRES